MPAPHMVCLGFILGCKPSSATSYILSALIVIGILAGFRLLFYAVYRLLHREETTDYGSESSDNVIEMPRQEQHLQQSPRSDYRRSELSESKLVILAGGDDQVSFVAQPMGIQNK